MESYGEKLKKAREAKNLDYETISRETTISSIYLKGIEDEDTSVFPGEPYFIGFMRKYAEYLDIDPIPIVKMYQGKKLQEAPVPEGLIVHEKPHYFWPLVISGIVLFVGALVALFVIFLLPRLKKDLSNVVLDGSNSSKTYEMTGKTLSTRLYVGDKIKYRTEQGDIILTVSDTLFSFGFQCPVGTLYTELAEEVELDIDGDSRSDLIVYVSDISATDSSRGAEVRISRYGDGYVLSNAMQDSIPLASEVQTNHKQLVVFEDNRAYPFTLNGSFRGSCMFRYRIDRHKNVESYFSNGELVTMTANNGVRVWMSNSNAVKFTIIADSKTYNLDVGKAGQVLVEDIKWIRDTDGKYKLVVIELD